MIDEKKLEESLYKAITNVYTDNAFVVIESIEESFNYDEPGYDFILIVKGRYGVDREESEGGFVNHFEITLDPKWSYDFISGYFCKHVEEHL